MNRRIPDPLRAELDKAGVTGQLVHGGRHPLLKFRWRGHDWRLTIPSSPSDWRSIHNKRAALRRILREGR